MTEPTCCTCPPAPPQPETISRGGCIRFTNNGPQWHTNTRHTTLGLDTNVPPEIDGEGDLYVKLLPTLDVVYTAATPDETLTSKLITAGISGGVSGCTVKIYHLELAGGALVARHLDLRIAADYNLVRGEYSNLWLFVASVPGTEAA